MLVNLLICIGVGVTVGATIGEAIKIIYYDKALNEFLEGQLISGVNYKIVKKHLSKILRCKETTELAAEYGEALIMAVKGLYENNLMHFWLRIEKRMDECSWGTGLYAYNEVNKVIAEVYEEMYTALSREKRENFDNYRKNTL